MKKILSVLLVFIMVIGVSVPIAAAGPTPVAPRASLGFSVQGTAVPQNGVASTNAKDNHLVGESFDVTFSKNSFQWSAMGDGTYDIGKLASSWLNATGAVLGTDFGFKGVYVNSATGDITVSLTALREYTGTVSFFMNSGAGSTNSASKYIVVSSQTATITKTKAGGTAPVMTSHSGNISIKTGDKITFRIPADNFEWSVSSANKNGASLTDTSWIKLRNALAGDDFEVSYTTAPNTSGDVNVTLTARRAGNYSNLSLNMFGGIGGVASTASAAVNCSVTETGTGKINGIASGVTLGGNGALLNGTALHSSQLYSLNVQDNDELLIPLTAGMFTWDGTPPYSNSSVTSAQLKAGKIAVVAGKRSGSQVIDSTSPKVITQGNQTFISIKFKKPTNIVKDTDFSITLYFTVDKSRHTASSVSIEGAMTVDVLEIDDNDGYYDISDGSIAVPDRYISKATLYLGSGVTVRTSLLEGKRYSGVAKYEISASDEETIRKYPAIDQILVIKGSGLDRPSSKVTLEQMSENYYVYDVNFKYLGRSNDTLTYSSKYYLSRKELDIDEEDTGTIPEDGSTPDPNIPEPGDPEEGKPNNIHNNPSTGR